MYVHHQQQLVCLPVVDGTGGDYEKTPNITSIYDDLKVQAVINNINGKTSLGAPNAPVPAIMGMNFQVGGVVPFVLFVSAMYLETTLPQTMQRQ